MNITQLKLSQLKYYMDVAETGSFTKAGERNFTSQSNISYAIRELEKTLGLPLFIRRNNELTITNYGQELLPYVQKAFAELEAGCHSLEQLSDPDTGTVRLAFSFVYSLSTLPDLLRYIFLHSIKDGWQIDLQSVMLHKGEQKEIVEDKLLDGSADLGLTCVRVRENIDSVVIGEEEHVLLLPRSHPLAEARKLSLQDVKDEPFAILGELEGSGNWYAGVFESAGVTPRMVYAGPDWLSLFLGVSAGKFLTIAPRCDLSSYDIACVELDHPQHMRDLHLAWPNNRKLSKASLYVKQLILNYYR